MPMRRFASWLVLSSIFVFLLTGCAGTRPAPESPPPPLPATGLDPATRDARFAACFDFASLVSGGVVTPHWLDDGGFWFVRTTGDTVRCDPTTGTLQPWSPSMDPDPAATDPARPAGQPSPDGRWGLITVGDGLALVSTAGDTIDVTAAAADGLFWSDYGALWSPDSRRVVVEGWDMADTPTIPIVDWLDPAAPVNEEPATQAGRPRPVPRLHVFDVAAETLRPLDVSGGLPEPMLSCAGWVPGTGELLVIRFDRPMTRQDLLAVNPQTGALRILVSETTDTFIDGLAAAFLLDRYCRPVGDDTHFIWLSQRDGWRRPYLYRCDGTLVCPLTAGPVSTDRLELVDNDTGWVYLWARSDRSDPTSHHLCRVRLDGSGFAQLSQDPGRRTVSFAPDRSCFVENHSDLDRAPRSILRRADGTPVIDLDRADTSALEAWSWQPPSRATAKAADGVTDCYCALYLPPGFDPALRYPVIEVIYAGPQWMIVPRRFTPGEYGDTAAALAQLGYVAVIIDSPGTAGIGKAYQDAVFGRLGQIEIPDHVAALKNLAATRPWLDLSRVGVHGKSWGGYFALRALLLAPDVYKVGVASSLVADLATAPDGPIVPYLGLPRNNPEAYAAADCLPLADQLQGDLLITIGTGDRNTPFGQSMRMLRAFTEADKDVEVLVLPGEHHWLQGKSFTRWQRALRDYFREHLPPVAFEAIAR